MTSTDMASAEVLTPLETELLVALEDYDNWFAGFNPDDRASRMEGRKIVIRARAVIAKAKGGAQ